MAALQAFFSHLPADSGMAFVVVLHLSPERESSLAAILQRVTAMPVAQVDAPAPLARNRVYVIPPDRRLSISKGRLLLSPPERGSGRHVAVDLLFRSLAESCGPLAAAVVLSGADGDGCIGIERVKECGGLTSTTRCVSQDCCSWARAKPPTIRPAGSRRWTRSIACTPATPPHPAPRSCPCLTCKPR